MQIVHQLYFSKLVHSWSTETCGASFDEVLGYDLHLSFK